MGQTNLEYLCERFGKQGGTIHQYAEKFQLEAGELISMPRAILATMIDTHIRNSIPVKVAALKRGEELIVCPSSIQAMMSGVKHFSITKSLVVTLHYVDNTTESAQLTKNDISDETNVFAFVSAVQSKRG